MNTSTYAAFFRSFVRPATLLACSVFLSACLQNAKLNVTSTASTAAKSGSGTSVSAPVLTLVTPQSTQYPVINGTADASAVSVSIYTSPTCASGLVATTIPAILAGAGISPGSPAAPNATTTYYAQSTDANSNLSPCSAGITFTNDTVSPSAVTWSPNYPATVKQTSIPIALTFNEPVNGLTTADFSIIGSGWVSSVSASSGISFVVYVDVGTPASITTLQVALNAAAVLDDANNSNAGTSSVMITYYPTPSSVTGMTPSNSATPSITVNGGGSGITAAIYANDPTCLGGFKGSASMAGPSATITSSAVAATTNYYAKFIDAGGNESGCSAAFNYVFDNTPPVVTSVTASNANGSYGSGALITVMVTFTESVMVFLGTPQISLETGASDAVANYSSGANSPTLSFTFNVAAGHNSADLDYVATTSLALNGATIMDYAGNAAVLTLPTPGAAGSLSNNKNLLIDAVAPSPGSIVPSSGVNYTGNMTNSYNLSASETLSMPLQMNLSDISCGGGSWVAYNSNPPFTFSSGTQQLKTVYAQFRDSLNNTSSCVSISLYYEQLTVLPRYMAASEWNDYIRTSDFMTSCDGSETGQVPCVHGGEARKVVTSFGSCTGLVLADTLNVFDWDCVVSGTATFYSRFKSGKSLRNLLTATPAWANNSVYFSAGGAGQISVSRPWWNNVVTALPNSSLATQTLSSPSTIYVAISNMTTRGYNINADKIALVTISPYVLTWDNTYSSPVINSTNGETSSPDLKVVIGSGTQNFTWIEAYAAGASTGFKPDGLIASIDSKFAMIRSSRASNSNGEGIFIGSSTFTTRNNSLIDVESANNTADGVKIIGLGGSAAPAYNRLVRIKSFNNGNNGIRITNGPSNNTIMNAVVTNNGADGIQIADYSNGNRIVSVTATNNFDGGIRITGGANSVQDNLVHNSLALNNNYGFVMNTNSDYNTLSQIVASTNSNGLYLFDSSYNKLTGNFLYGGNAGNNCYELSGVNPGVDSFCANVNASNANIVSGKNVTGTGTMVGKVSVNDAANTSDTSGTATYSAALNFFDFDNEMRTWGKDGSAFANSDHRSNWTGAVGRIWDWSLKISDVDLLLRSGNGSTSNGAYTIGAACPAAAAGSNSISDVYGTTTYMKTAVEVMFDGVGNENGLCENNEECIYTPNFGTYQGHGTIGKCNFTPGTISGVTMSGFATNGR